LLLIAAASCAIAPWAQGTAVISLEKLPLASRVSNALASSVAYLAEAFWPMNLAVFYPYPLGALPAWKSAAALCLLLAVTATVLVYWRRSPYLLVGWFWYLGMLVPVIGLVQIGLHAMADRYMYLPQIGLWIAVGWGAQRAIRSWPHRAWVCGAAASLAIVALMACAAQQTTYWRDSEALWTAPLIARRRTTERTAISPASCSGKDNSPRRSTSSRPRWKSSLRTLWAIAVLAMP